MSTCVLFLIIISILLTVVVSFQNSRIPWSTRTFQLYDAFNKLPLELCDENAEIVMEEVKQELGTLFGYDDGSKAVGITGEIELIEVDGPTISVALKGRFWHATDTVMMRVESFIKQRIPEVIEVVLDMSKSAIIDDNRLNSSDMKGPKKLF